MHRLCAFRGTLMLAAGACPGLQWKRRPPGRLFRGSEPFPTRGGLRALAPQERRPDGWAPGGGRVHTGRGRTRPPAARSGRWWGRRTPAPWGSCRGRTSRGSVGRLRLGAPEGRDDALRGRRSRSSRNEGGSHHETVQKRSTWRRVVWSSMSRSATPHGLPACPAQGPGIPRAATRAPAPPPHCGRRRRGWRTGLPPGPKPPVAPRRRSRARSNPRPG